MGLCDDARGERARVELLLRMVDVGTASDASDGVEAEDDTPLRADALGGGGLIPSRVGVDWREDLRGVWREDDMARAVAERGRMVG